MPPSFVRILRLAVEGKAWDEHKHPRDRHGRFIRLGDSVQVGGRVAEVVGNRPGGKLDVRHSDGSTETVNAKQVEVTGKRAAETTAVQPLTDAEYAAHTQRVEQLLSEAAKDGRSTDLQYTLHQDGRVWNPERAAMHNRIVDAMYAKAENVPTDGKAVIAGGLGGAGKSTVLRKHAGVSPADYFTLNPDDVKEELARRGLVPSVTGLTPMEASPLVHEEASHIANLLAQRAYAERRNVVWDITMSSQGSVQRRIDEMRAAGYGSIDGVFVDIPVETSVERALSRHRRGLESRRAGQGYGGRYVPPSVIRASAASTGSSASKNRGLFDALHGQFDSWQLYDNSGTAPVKVGGSDNGNG